MTAMNKKMSRVIAKEQWRADQRHQRAIRSRSLADQSASWANQLWEVIQADLPWISASSPGLKQQVAWKPTKSLRKLAAGPKPELRVAREELAAAGEEGAERTASLEEELQHVREELAAAGEEGAERTVSLEEELQHVREELAAAAGEEGAERTASLEEQPSMDRNSCGSEQGTWGGEHISRESMKRLMEFYNHAYSGDMKSCHITQEVARAFTSAKWANRCDEATTALLAASMNNLSEGTKVASVGGGPGNDACGFLVYNQLLEQPAQQVEVCVYDFSLSWEHIVEFVGKCNAVAPLGNLNFRQCDLQASTSDDVNLHIVSHVQTYDFWLFCYVIHESRACEHLLLAELLKSSKDGARFIVLELCTPDLDMMISTACSVGEFEIQRIGGTEDAPFCGVCLTKLTSTETPP